MHIYTGAFRHKTTRRKKNIYESKTVFFWEAMRPTVLARYRTSSDRKIRLLVCARAGRRAAYPNVSTAHVTRPYGRVTWDVNLFACPEINFNFIYALDITYGTLYG
jgi:hypothetical protein